MSQPNAMVTRAAGRFALAAAWMLAGSAAAQLAPGMDGRLLDSNAEVGGSRYNTTAPQPSFQAGNLIATGNVTGGRAFRGYSPIRDSSSLFTSIPTSSLNFFVRDSVGLGNVYDSISPPAASAFFNPSLTVTNAGGIGAGLNQAGTSLPQSTYIVPRTSLYDPIEPLGTAMGADLRNRAMPVGSYDTSLYDALDPARLRTSTEDRIRLTQEADALRVSPLFGQPDDSVNRMLETVPYTRSETVNPYALDSEEEDDRGANPVLRGARMLEEQGIGRNRDPLITTSTDLLAPGDFAPRLFSTPPQAVDPRIPTADEAESRFAVTPDPRGTFGTGALTTPLTDFTRTSPQSFSAESVAALSTAVDFLSQLAVNEAMMQEVTSGGGLLDTYDQAIAVVSEYSALPVTTLAVSRDERIDDAIARAENLMRDGEYYRAASLFRVAAGMDRDNPLIRLGQAHALIAAGEYRTAIVHLTAVIDSFPAFPYLRMALTEFIQDPNLLDLRRADLEQRLERREDYRLRFLLGYIEYYSDLEKFGLPNLQKAAAGAPRGSVIQRFPDILTAPDQFPLNLDALNTTPPANKDVPPAP